MNDARSLRFYALAACVLLWAAWLYAPSVSLPFFWDDVVHFRGVQRVTYDYILTHADLGVYYTRYYRPILNMILKATTDGGYPFAPAWHALLLFNHLLNVALVGALARALRLNPLAAMLVFGVFPHLYQAVIWILAWFHPAVTTCLLVTCLAALYYLRKPKRWDLLITAWIVGSLAPFVHENGMTIGGIVLLLALFVQRERWRRALVVVMPMGVSSAAYLVLMQLATGHAQVVNDAVHRYAGIAIAGVVIGAALVGAAVSYRRQIRGLLAHRRWWMVGGGAAVLVGGGGFAALYHSPLWVEVRPNIAYFMQGFTFPTQFISRYWNADIETAVWLSALPMLVVFGIALWRARNRMILILALLWFVLASLPAVLFLTQDYMITAPRLLYYSAPAIALFYAGVMSYYASKQRYLMAAATVVVVALSAAYVRHHEDLHATLDAAYDECIALLPADGATPIEMLNAPRWLVPQFNPFSMDLMGAVFVPDYISIRDFISLNTAYEYTQIYTILDRDTMYWRDRVTGMDGTVPEGVTFEVVFVFEADGERIRCRLLE